MDLIPGPPPNIHSPVYRSGAVLGKCSFVRSAAPAPLGPSRPIDLIAYKKMHGSQGEGVMPICSGRFIISLLELHIPDFDETVFLD